MNKKIIFIQFTDPGWYPPLQHSSKIIADRGWKVLFLGLNNFQNVEMTFPSHKNISVERMNFINSGIMQKVSYVWFCLWALFRVFCFQPKWIYASDHFSAPIAFLLLKMGWKVIYHEHDSPDVSETQNNKVSLFMRMVYCARKKLLESATACIFPSEGRIDKVKAEGYSLAPTYLVWNCPGLYEMEHSELKANGSEEGILKLYYHGTIVPERIPVSIIEALSECKGNVEFTILGYETVGDLNYKNKLVEVAEKHGIGSSLKFYPPMSRNDMWEYVRSCDVGLAFVPSQSSDVNLQKMVGASNKVFDYLSCGLAVLVTRSSEWDEICVDPGYGMSCCPEQKESICEAFDWLWEHKQQVKDMGEKGKSKIISDWNYEKQFEPILSLIEE